MNDIIVVTALAKAQQLLLDLQEREYILSQVNAAKGGHSYVLVPYLRYLSYWFLSNIKFIEHKLLAISTKNFT